MTDVVEAEKVENVTADVVVADNAASEPESKSETDWKSEARKWESRAKANKEAADKLAALEEASKTEAEKLAERERAAAERIARAEARAARMEIALEHHLSPEDAELLDDFTDVELMARVAKRLAAVSEDKRKAAPVVATAGESPKGDGMADERAFINALVGR